MLRLSVVVRTATAVAAIVLSGTAPSHAIVRVPVAQSYADTVRIGILSNSGAVGVCPDTPFVGKATLNFVLKALDTAHIPHVVVKQSLTATADTILAMFPGTLPNVLVHVNAGWGGFNGFNIDTVLRWGAENNMGIVEVGDDDGLSLDSVFRWVVSTDRWSPMVTGLWLDKPEDSLYMRLQPGSDTVTNPSEYPYLNGLVRNAVDSVLHDSVMHFKPVAKAADGRALAQVGRCEADPDTYGPDSITTNTILRFAYQQGYNAACDSVSTTGPGDQVCSLRVVGEPGEYWVISVIRDSIPVGLGIGERRAVGLSFQPQFLVNDTAAQQIVYDAIMYASLVHANNPAGVIGRPFRPSRFSGARALISRRGEVVRVVDLKGRVVYRGDAHQYLARTATTGHAGVFLVTARTGSTPRALPIVISR